MGHRWSLGGFDRDGRCAELCYWPVNCSEGSAAGRWDFGDAQPSVRRAGGTRSIGVHAPGPDQLGRTPGPVTPGSARFCVPEPVGTCTAILGADEPIRLRDFIQEGVPVRLGIRVQVGVRICQRLCVSFCFSLRFCFSLCFCLRLCFVVSDPFRISDLFEPVADPEHHPAVDPVFAAAVDPVFAATVESVLCTAVDPVFVPAVESVLGSGVDLEFVCVCDG
jgi:hypothetical protein